MLPDLNKKTGLVQLPKLGQTKFSKSKNIEGTIKNVTISRSAGKWHISSNCDDVTVATVKPTGEAIGIDRGG